MKQLRNPGKEQRFPILFAPAPKQPTVPTTQNTTARLPQKAPYKIMGG